MRFNKILRETDIAVMVDKIYDALGFRALPLELCPPTGPLFQAICDLSEEVEVRELPLIALPHLKLRGSVLYRGVAVYPGLEALVKTRPVPAWDELSVTASTGLEEGDTVLLWDMPEAEVEALLAEGEGLIRPLEKLSVEQLRTAELVSGDVDDAARLIAQYLLDRGEAWEHELEFLATEELARRQCEERGYEITVKPVYQKFLTELDRYRELRAWQAWTAEKVLRHFRKE